MRARARVGRETVSFLLLPCERLYLILLLLLLLILLQYGASNSFLFSVGDEAVFHLLVTCFIIFIYVITSLAITLIFVTFTRLNAFNTVNVRSVGTRAICLSVGW